MNVLKADGGFVWLIVGVFWVIAQIAGAAAKKKQPLRPPVAPGDEPGETPGDPFAELLRKMAGVQEFRVEPPTVTEEPAEMPFTPSPMRRNEVRTKNPWKPGDIEALPDIEPLRRETMGQKDIPPAPSKIQEIDIRPKMSAFRNSVPSIRLPAMNLSFNGSATSIQNVPNLGKIISPSDKNSLRRAMLSHIIFSPPKALSRTSE
jgi:hypothetical protein